MPDYYIGEIMLCGFGYAPEGFLPCDGRTLPITQHSALYSLLGTLYGGDGHTTFMLPNLNARVALGAGAGPGLSNYAQGLAGGQDCVTLDPARLPLHSHAVHASAGGPRVNVTTPQGNLPAGGSAYNVYAGATDGSAMNANTLPPPPPSQPHENRQPYLCVNFVICCDGLFPPRD